MTAPAPVSQPRRVTAADLRLADLVWVWAWGRWRRGTVTQLAQVRVRVRLDRDPADPQRRERWYAATAEEPVYRGGLAPPVTYRCERPDCQLATIGVPGQTAEQVRQLHEAAAHTGHPAAATAQPAAVWIATPRRGIAAHALQPATHSALPTPGQPPQRWTRCRRIVVYDERAYGLVLTAADAIADYHVTWCVLCYPGGRQ